MPGVLEKDVLGLQIAVHCVLDVAEVVQREGNLGKQRNGELLRQRKIERWEGGSAVPCSDSLLDLGKEGRMT